MLNILLKNQLLVLLAIIFLGYMLGNIRFKGIAVGNPMCLFVAIAAGALGAEIPAIITNLGIVFFVYSVGLQAGPQFFALFGKRGLKFSALSIFTVCFGAAITLLLAYLLNVRLESAVGIFAGAVTSTPALASAINALEAYFPASSGVTSLGYAFAYPFGLVSQLIFIQLAPKIFAAKINEEKQLAREAKQRLEFHSRQYLLTNANFAGKKIEEYDLHNFCRVNLSRYKHGNEIKICVPESVLRLGDIVIAVGSEEELEKFKVLFGEEVKTEMPKDSNFESKDIYISGPNVINKTLRDLALPETRGITITRLYRGDTIISPTGHVVLETGDLIRVVGQKEDVAYFAGQAGSEKRRLDDTNLLILAVGMFVGALIGEIPIEIGRLSFKLGLAGGPLLAALILGHFGRVGRQSVRIPNATKFFLREIGLVFFLIGVGVKTGHELVMAAHTYNAFVFLFMGAVISLVTIFGSMFLIYKVFKTPVTESLGALCGARTSSSSLGVLIKTLDDESPSITYAAAYPVAIIALTLMGQIMVWVGMIFL
ncbi:MAG: hypothetical protein HYT75_01030 [Deltaproteobacteria bacterium]|nr:hypothetical protein [Deltaproteobacteria bacterium]MBI2341128.1 hypothetical protein [Deltaproteobacteria bacterium]